MYTISTKSRSAPEKKKNQTMDIGGQIAVCVSVKKNARTVYLNKENACL